MPYVSEIIAKNLKYFTDGEFVMDCINTVAEILCPEKKELISKTSLSRITVPRRLDDMAKYRSSVDGNFRKFQCLFYLSRLQYLSEF